VQACPEKLLLDYNSRSWLHSRYEHARLSERDGRYANNRVENSHLPFRRRELAVLRFRQMKALQVFASVRASLHNHVTSDRHLIDRPTYKLHRSTALAEWQSLMA
jgi:putative transposase